MHSIYVILYETYIFSIRWMYCEVLKNSWTDPPSLLSINLISTENSVWQIYIILKKLYKRIREKISFWSFHYLFFKVQNITFQLVPIFMWWKENFMKLSRKIFIFGKLFMKISKTVWNFRAMARLAPYMYLSFEWMSLSLIASLVTNRDSQS